MFFFGFVYNGLHILCSCFTCILVFLWDFLPFVCLLDFFNKLPTLVQLLEGFLHLQHGCLLLRFKQSPHLGIKKIKGYKSQGKGNLMDLNYNNFSLHAMSLPKGLQSKNKPANFKQTKQKSKKMLTWCKDSSNRSAIRAKQFDNNILRRWSGARNLKHKFISHSSPSPERIICALKHSFACFW